jgi:DNA-binding GntR family transcriptional regulator
MVLSTKKSSGSKESYPVSRSKAVNDGTSFEIFSHTATVSEQVRRRILEGVYAPGETLTESRLMADLNVGRTPVREALRQLEADELVTIMPRKGATVNKPSLKDVEETYSIAGALEALAASLSVSRMDQNTVKKLIDLQNAGKKKQAENDIRNYCNINSEFHQTLVEHCDNVKLIRMIKALRRHTHRFRLITFAVPGRIQRSVEEHERLLECVKRGDAKAVRKVMEDHWNHTREMLVQYLAEFSILTNL